jgi:uncharacterized membrane protein YbhN (UPF0104 family)
MINYRFGQISKRILPWVVTIGIFAYLFHQMTVSEVLETAAHVNLWLFIPVITIGFIFYFLWDVLVYTIVFKDVGIQVAYREMAPIRGAAHLLTIINHFAGSGGVALLMNRWKKIPISQTGSVVVFKLFIEYYGLLALCLLTAFHIPEVDLALFFSNAAEGDLVRMIIISWIIFAFVLIFFHFILPRTDGFKKIKDSQVLNAFRDISPRKYFIFVLVQLVGFFSFDVLMVFFALIVFKLEIPFLLFITLFPIVRLIEAIPISVMGLGTSQMAMLWLFTPLTGNAGSKLSISVSILAFSLLVTIFSNLGRFLVGSVSIGFLPKSVWGLQK